MLGEPSGRFAVEREHGDDHRWSVRSVDLDRQVELVRARVEAGVDGAPRDVVVRVDRLERGEQLGCRLAQDAGGGDRPAADEQRLEGPVLGEDGQRLVVVVAPYRVGARQQLAPVGQCDEGRDAELER